MNLQTKFSIFSTLLVSTVVGGTTGAIYWNERETLNSALKEERIVLIKRLEVISHDSILTSDYLPLIRYLRELKASSDEILWVGVLHAGEYVAHTESRWIGKSPVDAVTLRVSQSPDPVEVGYAEEGKDVLEDASPVLAGDARIGTIRVGFSREVIEEKFRNSLEKTAKRILGVGLAVFVLGAGASLLLARTITRRLSQLVQGARTISMGNFNNLMRIGGSDEVYELAVEFNLMAAQLGKLYSQVQNQADTLAKANLELLKLDSIKKNFFSLVSHELRGPLTTIKGYLTMILDSEGLEDWAKQEKQVKIIQEETDRIAKMVNEFMDLARIEAGTFILEMRNVNPVLLIDFVTERMELVAEGQKVKFMSDLDKSLPNFKGDPERLCQVLINLIGNALKFTSEGGSILMSVFRIPKGRRVDDVEKVGFSIRDTGKGIRKEDLEKIFDRYYQAEGEEKKKGLGLGLAFAKEVVERHGGKIWAESAGPGTGSTFTFIFPLLIVEEKTGG